LKYPVVEASPKAPIVTTGLSIFRCSAN